jgi:hypothetical protein
MQHDIAKPGELISETTEDHLVDCARYATMSRPWVAGLPLWPGSNGRPRGFFVCMPEISLRNICRTDGEISRLFKYKFLFHEKI